MPAVGLVAPNFPVGVVELTVELGLFTPGDDAVCLGARLVPSNLRFVSFDMRSLTRRQRPVLDSVGDAILLALLAGVNTRRIAAVMSDFPVGVIEFTIEPRPFTRSDGAVSLGPRLVPLNPRLASLDSRGLSTRN